MSRKFIANGILTDWFYFSGHVSDSIGLVHVASFWHDYDEELRKDLKTRRWFVSGIDNSTKRRVYIPMLWWDIDNQLVMATNGLRFVLHGNPVTVATIDNYEYDAENHRLVLRSFRNSSS